MSRHGQAVLGERSEGRMVPILLFESSVPRARQLYAHKLMPSTIRQYSILQGVINIGMPLRPEGFACCPFHPILAEERAI